MYLYNYTFTICCLRILKIIHYLVSNNRSKITTSVIYWHTNGNKNEFELNDMFNNLDIQNWNSILETYCNFQWRHSRIFYGEKLSKEHLDMEFMFDEMDQTTALSIHLHAKPEFYKGETALQASIYYLMSKHFGSTKTLQMRN